MEVIRMLLLKYYNSSAQFAIQLYSIPGNTTISDFCDVICNLKRVDEIDGKSTYSFDNPNQTDAILQYYKSNIESDRSLYILFVADRASYREDDVFKKDMEETSKTLQKIEIVGKTITVLVDKDSEQYFPHGIVNDGTNAVEIASLINDRLISYYGKDEVTEKSTATTTTFDSLHISISEPSDSTNLQINKTNMSLTDIQMMSATEFVIPATVFYFNPEVLDVSRPMERAAIRYSNIRKMTKGESLIENGSTPLLLTSTDSSFTKDPTPDKDALSTMISKIAVELSSFSAIPFIPDNITPPPDQLMITTESTTIIPFVWTRNTDDFGEEDSIILADSLASTNDHWPKHETTSSNSFGSSDKNTASNHSSNSFNADTTNDPSNNKTLIEDHIRTPIPSSDSILETSKNLAKQQIIEISKPSSAESNVRKINALSESTSTVTSGNTFTPELEELNILKKPLNSKATANFREASLIDVDDLKSQEDTERHILQGRFPPSSNVGLQTMSPISDRRPTVVMDPKTVHLKNDSLPLPLSSTVTTTTLLTPTSSLKSTTRNKGSNNSVAVTDQDISMISGAKNTVINKSVTNVPQVFNSTMAMEVPLLSEKNTTAEQQFMSTKTDGKSTVVSNKVVMNSKTSLSVTVPAIEINDLAYSLEGLPISDGMKLDDSVDSVNDLTTSISGSKQSIITSNTILMPTPLQTQNVAKESGGNRTNIANWQNTISNYSVFEDYKVIDNLPYIEMMMSTAAIDKSLESVISQNISEDGHTVDANELSLTTTAKTVRNSTNKSEPSEVPGKIFDLKRSKSLSAANFSTASSEVPDLSLQNKTSYAEETSRNFQSTPLETLSSPHENSFAVFGRLFSFADTSQTTTVLNSFLKNEKRLPVDSESTTILPATVLPNAAIFVSSIASGKENFIIGKIPTQKNIESLNRPTVSANGRDSDEKTTASNSLIAKAQVPFAVNNTMSDHIPTNSESELLMPETESLLSPKGIFMNIPANVTARDTTKLPENEVTMISTSSFESTTSLASSTVFNVKVPLSMVGNNKLKNVAGIRHNYSYLLIDEVAYNEQNQAEGGFSVDEETILLDERPNTNDDLYSYEVTDIPQQFSTDEIVLKKLILLHSTTKPAKQFVSRSITARNESMKANVNTVSSGTLENVTTTRSSYPVNITDFLAVTLPPNSPEDITINTEMLSASMLSQEHENEKSDNPAQNPIMEMTKMSSKNTTDSQSINSMETTSSTQHFEKISQLSFANSKINSLPHEIGDGGNIQSRKYAVIASKPEIDEITFLKIKHQKTIYQTETRLQPAKDEVSLLSTALIDSNFSFFKQNDDNTGKSSAINEVLTNPTRTTDVTNLLEHATVFQKASSFTSSINSSEWSQPNDYIATEKVEKESEIKVGISNNVNFADQKIDITSNTGTIQFSSEDKKAPETAELIQKAMQNDSLFSSEDEMVEEQEDVFNKDQTNKTRRRKVSSQSTKEISDIIFS